MMEQPNKVRAGEPYHYHWAANDKNQNIKNSSKLFVCLPQHWKVIQSNQCSLMDYVSLLSRYQAGHRVLKKQPCVLVYKLYSTQLLYYI